MTSLIFDLSIIVLPRLHKRSFQQELNKESTSHRPKNLKVKSRADLEEPSTDGTLLGELFFRRLDVEENGTLDIMPILSEPSLQMKRSNSLLFIWCLTMYDVINTQTLELRVYLISIFLITLLYAFTYIASCLLTNGSMKNIESMRYRSEIRTVKDWYRKQ